MHRRALLTKFLSPSATAESTPSFTAGSSLNPYSGTWDFAQAAHLLRRAMFAPTYEDIKTAVADGLEATLDKLFATQPLPDPPLNTYFADDPLVPIGETWVNADHSSNNQNGVFTRGYRKASLNVWTLGMMRDEGVSIREKMTLFWHNHFATGDLNNPNAVYDYITLLRENALGNFRELTKSITVDRAMLKFLNNDQNSKESPNENYARELFELFTIGKGDLAGPGDYTNYTEQDIAAAAKVLTGWRVRDFGQVNAAVPTEVIFRSGRHDESDKEFSHRFNNTIISNNGEEEYKDLVDMIFAQAEVARFICRKFYRWLVYYKIDEAAEMNIIAPLANTLITNDLNVAAVLRQLLGSEHFFSGEYNGVMIKNPYDAMLAAMKPLNLPMPSDAEQYQRVMIRLFQFAEDLQMEYYEPPTVAGWKAYYQEPQYYRNWINSVTLPKRFEFSDTVLGLPRPTRIMGFTIQADVLALVDEVFADANNGVSGAPSPFLITDFIAQLAQLFLPKTLSTSQVDYLKEILIPGLPDFEWSVEFEHYQEHLDDEATVEAMANKVRSFLSALLHLPEFQLM
ncbi:MAG: DUF1800 family protein, partial [Saprospiraceae bacterium]